MDKLLKKAKKIHSFNMDDFNPMVKYIFRDFDEVPILLCEILDKIIDYSRLDIDEQCDDKFACLFGCLDISDDNEYPEFSTSDIIYDIVCNSKIKNLKLFKKNVNKLRNKFTQIDTMLINDIGEFNNYPSGIMNNIKDMLFFLIDKQFK